MIILVQNHFEIHTRFFFHNIYFPELLKALWWNWNEVFCCGLDAVSLSLVLSVQKWKVLGIFREEPRQDRWWVTEPWPSPEKLTLAPRWFGWVDFFLLGHLSQKRDPNPFLAISPHVLFHLHRLSHSQVHCHEVTQPRRDLPDTSTTLLGFLS